MIRNADWRTGYDVGYEDSQHSYDADVTFAIEEGFSHPGIAKAGAYWLGMLGFALAAPAATEQAMLAVDRAETFHMIGGNAWAWLDAEIRGER